MSKLNATDIQGFALRGYNLPCARYLFLKVESAEGARRFIDRILGQITTGERWDHGKPLFTVNMAFTQKGLERLELPEATLLTFPIDFQQGMKARGEILYDTGRNGPEHWDAVWRDDTVDIWAGVNAQSEEIREQKCGELIALMVETGGVTVAGFQDAALLRIDNEVSPKEHFGYTDGFGNPDFLGVVRDSQPGHGKLNQHGEWVSLATGELLLGYADEAGELPVAPIPHLLANNGTFMVYRKLHQNVATFRNYLNEKGAQYPGGKEKLASKFVGRWRDGTPVERSPDKPDPVLVRDSNNNVDFTLGGDPHGVRCPIGAHLRRVNPRDDFGFNGQLVNRRRITRRGMPYGAYVPEDQPVSDTAEHGVVFMVLNASISRQFEFVQQQWIEYGNDAKSGNDKDFLMGNHEGRGKFVVQGDPPFVCGRLPNFVELRGGAYFFVPSMTALKMMALGEVDPR
jgi:Dyp-type peroxidase family